MFIWEIFLFYVLIQFSSGTEKKTKKKPGKGKSAADTVAAVVVTGRKAKAKAAFEISCDGRIIYSKVN